MQHIPIALVGGGLATKICALAFLHSGYAFVWFTGRPAGQNTHDDTRTTTIHHAGQVMLHTLGVWDDIKEAAWPLHDMKVCAGTPEQSQNWPLHWSSETPPMAYVVPNQTLNSVLAQHTASCAKQPVNIVNITPSAPTHFTDSEQRDWQCDLMVGCDGTKSALRTQAGLPAFDQNRQQTAFIARIATEKPIATSAYQRFLPTGPLALMALGTYEAAMVWTCHNAHAQTLQNIEESAFNDIVTESFGTELGALSLKTAVLPWPLTPCYVPKIACPGFVLAGDAAHALHPLAGMGFNLALADVAILLDCLQTAKKQGCNAGHISITSAYQARRTKEILAMTMVTQSLDRLLSVPQIKHQSRPHSRHQARLQRWVTGLAHKSMASIKHTPLHPHLLDWAMGGKLAPAPLFAGKLSGS